MYSLPCHHESKGTEAREVALNQLLAVVSKCIATWWHEASAFYAASLVPFSCAISLTNPCQPLIGAVSAKLQKPHSPAVPGL